MRLNAKAFALAAGITAAAAFTACAVMIALAPGFGTSFLSDVTHLDLTALSRTLTWATYFEGLVFWTLGAGLAFGTAGWIYNALAGTASSTTSVH